MEWTRSSCVKPFIAVLATPQRRMISVCFLLLLWYFLHSIDITGSGDRHSNLASKQILVLNQQQPNLGPIETKRSSKKLPALPPFAVYHKGRSITTRGLEAASQAQKQVSEAGGFYRFAYMLIPDVFDPDSVSQSADVFALRKTLGEEAVDVVDFKDYELNFGHLLASHQNISGEYPWPWVFCDMADMTYYQKYIRKWPNYLTHVWSIEIDVGWTGNLVDILKRILPSSSNTKFDLVSMGVRQPGPHDWMWYGTHNWLEANQIWCSWNQVQRYSRKLLDAIVAENLKGHVQSCEMSAPSICMLHENWCTVYKHWNLVTWKAADEPNTTGYGRDGTELFYAAPPISVEEWQWVVSRYKNATNLAIQGFAEPPLGLLYHPIKF